MCSAHTSFCERRLLVCVLWGSTQPDKQNPRKNKEEGGGCASHSKRNPASCHPFNRLGAKYPIWYRNKKEYITQNLHSPMHDCPLPDVLLYEKMATNVNSWRHDEFSKPCRPAAGRTLQWEESRVLVGRSQGVTIGWCRWNIWDDQRHSGAITGNNLHRRRFQQCS